MLSKIFGGIKMTWKRLILFAVISGVITGLIALLTPDNNSIHQIAVTFETWVVLAIIVVVNCDRPLDADLKTFVYFLISQPLVYLVQVPFSRMGFGLFSYYWPYWFIWTAATLPGAFIAWFIKKDDLPGALILSVALAVGLHNGYGNAQRMYVKRGYIPDGSGAWYRGKPCAQYETDIANDDDLVLFLSKPLKR